VRKGRSHHHDEHEEHVNHEAWVIPYADMLTLLMGLFLVLWAIGNEDLAKLRQFSQSFADQVGISSPFSGGSGLLAAEAAAASTTTIAPVPPGEVEAGRAALAREAAAGQFAAAAARELDRAEAVIRDRAHREGVGGAITFRREERGLVVSIVSDDVLFAPGSAALEAQGTRTLDAVGAALGSIENRIAIEGHTDDLPISNPRFPSNWELSTARAGAVLRYLVDRHGLRPDQLVAGGYADQRPLADNAHPAGRARNRRVDVAVLSLVSTTGDTDRGDRT
jgi:chemotaxis protein MotB